MYLDVAETVAILGISQTAEDWEKAFCDQESGVGIFLGAKGCRITMKASNNMTYSVK
jgi:hypothetical protein